MAGIWAQNDNQVIVRLGIKKNLANKLQSLEMYISDGHYLI